MRLLVMALITAMLMGCAQGSETPAVTGRLFFLGAEKLTVAERGKVTSRAWPQGVTDVALAPSGNYLAGLSDGQVVFIPGQDLRPKRLFAATAGARLVWSPDSRLLAVVEPAKITVWSEPSARTSTYDLPRSGANRAVWSPDGRYLAVQVGTGNVENFSLWLVDVEQGGVTQVAAPSWNPAWHPTQPRLLYAAPGGRESSDQLMVLDVGQEPRVFLDQEALTRAKPELADLWKANRMVIYSIGWAPHGKTFGFNFKAAGGDPRFVTVVGDFTGGVMAARVWPVYPQPNMTPPLPCSPGPLQWGPEDLGILVRMANPGCEGKLERLHPTNLTSIGDPVSVTPRSLLTLSPDGKWALTYGGTGVVELFPSNTPTSRTTLKAEGAFLGWAP